MRNKIISKIKDSLLKTTQKEFLDLETRLFETREKTIEESMIKEMDNPLTSQEYIDLSMSSGDQITDHTRLLAQEKIQNQREILKTYEWDKDIKDISSSKGKMMERKQEEEAYKSDVFLLDEIKSICLDFNMKFEPIKNLLFYDDKQKYEIIPIIEGYSSSLKHESGKGNANYDKFYALAIAEDFGTPEERREGKKPKSKTPRVLLFYMTDRMKNTFVHVHSWGSTKYSVTRYVKAWEIQNPVHNFMGLSVKSSAAFFILISLITSTQSMAVTWLLSVGLGVFSAFLITCLRVNQDKSKIDSYDPNEKFYFTDSKWRKNI